MKQETGKLKGFGIGLSMAAMAALASGVAPGARGICSGSCQSCLACGLTAVPLILWIASRGGKRLERLPAPHGRPPAGDTLQTEGTDSPRTECSAR